MIFSSCDKVTLEPDAAAISVAAAERTVTVTFTVCLMYVRLNCCSLVVVKDFGVFVFVVATTSCYYDLSNHACTDYTPDGGYSIIISITDAAGIISNADRLISGVF